MSDKIDVLAVMGEAADWLLQDINPEVSERIVKARAAVAELIDAVKQNRQLAIDFAKSTEYGDELTWQASEYRVEKALSNMEGK